MSEFGLIQLNDKHKDCFTLQIVEFLEGIALTLGSALERKQMESAIKTQTRELKTQNSELTQFNLAMVDRELRMVELKNQMNKLCARLGEPPIFPH